VVEWSLCTVKTTVPCLRCAGRTKNSSCRQSQLRTQTNGRSRLLFAALFQKEPQKTVAECLQSSVTQRQRSGTELYGATEPKSAWSPSRFLLRDLHDLPWGRLVRPALQQHYSSPA